MASLKVTLTGTYQAVNVGSATIQKATRGYGDAMIFFGTAIPGTDANSFLLSGNEAQYFETADTIYARTPHGVSVDIIVGS